MSQLSKSLVWSVIRNNHASIMKRPNCRTFSREAFNLKKIHSPKYSGFINAGAIDIIPNKDGKGISILQRKKHNMNKPSKNHMYTAKRCSDRKAFRSIRILTKVHKVRPDLEMTALARASTILSEQKRAAGVTTTRPHLVKLSQWRKRDARRKAYKAKNADKFSARKLKGSAAWKVEFKKRLAAKEAAKKAAKAADTKA